MEEVKPRYVIWCVLYYPGCLSTHCLCTRALYDDMSIIRIEPLLFDHWPRELRSVVSRSMMKNSYEPCPPRMTLYQRPIGLPSGIKRYHMQYLRMNLTNSANQVLSGKRARFGKVNVKYITSRSSIYIDSQPKMLCTSTWFLTPSSCLLIECTRRIMIPQMISA